MSEAACILIHLWAKGDVDPGEVERHLQEGRDRLRGDLVQSIALSDGGDGVAGTLVVGMDPEAMRSLADACSLSARARWRLAGIDPELFAGGAGPDAYASVVLDPGDPPVPFDDPMVTQIIKDQYAWYFPALGTRHVASSWLTHDGVRTSGSLTVFTADDSEEAKWMAGLDPWRRVARGAVVRVPSGVFTRRAAPVGPGTQRFGHFACGRPDSVGEPYP